MPLRIASASSRGNKIKNIFSRIGAVIVILIVVFSCLIPNFYVNALSLDDTVENFKYDGETYSGTVSSVIVALANKYCGEDGKYSQRDYPWTALFASGGGQSDGLLVGSGTICNWDDIKGEDVGNALIKIFECKANMTLDASGMGDDFADNSYAKTMESYFSGFINYYTTTSDSNVDKGTQEKVSNAVERYDDTNSTFNYYNLIINKSLRLAENASIASIIELGRDHNNYDIKSGTTLKAITSNTDAAFKALMVGAVASSYAGAINSVTNASDQAEALLSESFSGQISGWSWNPEDDVMYDFHDSEGNPISQVNISEDGTSYFSITGMIYQVCKDISYSVILPVAGIILAFIFAWQIYEAVCERNNMADMGTGFFIQIIVRMCIMILIVLAAWTLTEWVFSLGQWIVNQTSVVVYENFTQGGMMDTIESYVTDERSADDILTWVLAYKICVNDAIDFGNTLIMLVQGLIINIGMYVVSLIVYVIVYVRLIEMYIQCALAPIPLATMANRTWNQTALNFIRSVFALALQGFIIYLCIEIFNILIVRVIEDGLSGADFTGSMWQVIGYALILVFCLFKSSSISKSIVDAR